VKNNFSLLAPYCINTKCLDGKSFHAMLLVNVSRLQPGQTITKQFEHEIPQKWRKFLLSFMSDEKNSKVLSVSQVEVCKRVKKKKILRQCHLWLTTRFFPWMSFLKISSPRWVCVCMPWRLAAASTDSCG